MNKFQWTVQVWLCRRFLRTMTVDKVAVMSHVTGYPAESIFAMSLGRRPREEIQRVVAHR